MRNPDPTRTRTKCILENHDRLGPEPTKTSNVWTETDQSIYENLGPDQLVPGGP